MFSTVGVGDRSYPPGRCPSHLAPSGRAPLHPHISRHAEAKTKVTQERKQHGAVDAPDTKRPVGRQGVLPPQGRCRICKHADLARIFTGGLGSEKPWPPAGHRCKHLQPSPTVSPPFLPTAAAWDTRERSAKGECWRLNEAFLERVQKTPRQAVSAVFRAVSRKFTVLFLDFALGVRNTVCNGCGENMSRLRGVSRWTVT